MNTSTVKVREVVPDFDLIHLPLPMQPTIVNIYLIDGGSEWALFDTEMHTGESVAAFREALDLIGLGKIICTHHHPDHFGTSSHYRELTRAPIYLHLLEAELAEFYTRSELRPESIRFSLKTEFRARPWETSRARERSSVRCTGLSIPTSRSPTAIRFRSEAARSRSCGLLATPPDTA